MKIHNVLLGIIVMFITVASMAAETYKKVYAKGIKEYKAKKYKESVVTLGEAVKLAKTPTEKYSSMYYQGYSLRKLRKNNEAAKVFENLIKVEKLSEKQKNNVFSQYLHNVYWSKKFKEVISIAEKTLADDKATTNMKINSAYLACLSSSVLKKYADKEKYAKKICELNSKGYWHNRGLIYQSEALRAQKKYEEAEKVLNKKIIAKMHPTRQGMAYLERGHAKGSVKKYQDAVIEYTTVYELPNAHPNHKAVAIVCAIEKLNAAGKPEEAMVWAERVELIKNKYWRTRGLRRHAQLLQKQGKLEAAKKKWGECKKSGPWWKKTADKQIGIIDKKLEAK